MAASTVAPKAPRTRKAASPSTRAERTPDLIPVEHRGYLLRTSNSDGTAHGGFRWPAEGYVEAFDWNDRPICGYGLHGLMNAIGSVSYLKIGQEDVLWQVVLCDARLAVEIDGDKHKIPWGFVVFSGNREGAIDHLRSVGCFDEARACFGVVAASGYSGQAAASGDSGQAAASGYSGQAAASGYRGQAAASGDSGQAAASGDSGQAAASGDSGQAAASGDSGQAAASGDRGQAAATGKDGVALATGAYGRACAGENGVLVVGYYDANGRRRLLTGYVGEDGIEPYRWYRAANGKLVDEGPVASALKPENAKETLYEKIKRMLTPLGILNDTEERS